MIDLHALDNFAQHHLQFEANCTQCFQNPTFSTPPTDPQILCGLDKIRTLVMRGDIDDACNICEQLCSHPIEDPRVQLNVRIHKLFELVHVAENTSRGHPTAYNDALQNALQYSQKLADFALNAFPEAYELFTESMMLFAYPESASTATAIQQRREKLADDLVSLTRMTVCARESCLSFLIRYLLLVYIQFKSPVVTPGQEPHPVESLILDLLSNDQTQPERTSRVAWKTDGSRPTKFNHRGEFEEADVQTLPERVSISRQDSIESLRFTNGDVLAALKNELGRVLINRQRFRNMVVEYCAARGLHVFETAQTAETSGARGQYPALSEDNERVLVALKNINPSALEMFPTMCKLRQLAKNGDFEGFLEAIGNVDPAMLENAPLLEFRVGQCQVMKHIQCSEFDRAIEVSQEKLGPLAKQYPEFLPALAETTTLLVYATDLKTVEDWPRRRKGKTERGEGSERVRNRGFGGDKRIRHERVSVDGKNGESEVQSFEEFLCESFGSVVEKASLEAVAFEAYNAYELKFEEPELIQVLKRLLDTHEEWQTQNMMKDRFSGALGVDEIVGGLEDGNRSVLKAGGDGGKGNESCKVEEERESTVLTLMEFLAMSRAEALAVVRNHPQADNAQSIMDSLLGTML